MNISQRLRTCAKHTGLDAVIELLQEAADELDALQARSQVQGEPIGEVGTMPGTSGFTMACFRADEVPVGTKIYTTPQPAQATQAEVTDAEIVAVMRDGNNCNYNDEAEHIQFARAILALPPVQVPMTPTERERELDRSPVDASWEAGDAFMEGIYAAEAHHAITAQAKKEDA